MGAIPDEAAIPALREAVRAGDRVAAAELLRALARHARHATRSDVEALAPLLRDPAWMHAVAALGAEAVGRDYRLAPLVHARPDLFSAEEMEGIDPWIVTRVAVMFLIGCGFVSGVGYAGWRWGLASPYPAIIGMVVGAAVGAAPMLVLDTLLTRWRHRRALASRAVAE